MPPEGQNNPLIEWFAREGIGRERLSLHPHAQMQDYLALHHQVDICLDTFPFSGCTVTNHALLMGVPTLTLAGHTAAGRQGAGILSHLGLESFIAEDEADFVEKGLAWAADLSTLAELRAGLRTRFEQSPIGQSALIAASLERALRIIWQRWCAGMPPVSFDVDSKRCLLSPPATNTENVSSECQK
jgi:predicted O-linked N-acetylglucosamine transferase (SPINDLY family)